MTQVRLSVITNIESPREKQFKLSATIGLESRNTELRDIQFKSILLEFGQSDNGTVTEAGLTVEATSDLTVWLSLKQIKWQLTYKEGLWSFSNELSIKFFEYSFQCVTQLRPTDSLTEVSFHLSELNEHKPLFRIADLGAPGNNILELFPRDLILRLHFDKNQIQVFHFEFSSDLLVNKPFGQGVLFRSNQGVLFLSWNRVEERLKFEFNPKGLEVSPIHWLQFIPGFKTLLLSSFGEEETNCPKSTALLNLFRFDLHTVSFFYEKKTLGFSAKGRAKVKQESLAYLLSDLINTPRMNDFFLQEEDQAGTCILTASTEGLHFSVQDLPHVIVPDIFRHIKNSFSSEFIEEIEKRFGKEVIHRLELGNSLLSVDELRFDLQKEVQVSMVFGYALPERINYGLFNTSEHYLFCYQAGKGPKEQEKLRFQLNFGTHGIGGKLIEFNVINVEKINATLADLITETEEGVLLNLNALVKAKTSEYGQFLIEKPTCKINLKKGTFQITGGIHSTTEKLCIPVQPVVARILNLFPSQNIPKEDKDKLTSQVVPFIQLENISFYDEEKQQLDLTALDKFLKQFFLEKYRSIDLIPHELKLLLEENSSHITPLLPDKLLSYLAIKIPAGFSFELEVLADRTFCFNLVVTPPSEKQRAEGIPDYLQIFAPSFGAVPTYFQGIRFRQFGFGNALLNHAIRFDMDFEWTLFPFDSLIAGMTSEFLRNSNEQSHEIANLTLLDGKHMYQSILLEKMILLVFPQTTIPIPVPVFYDRMAFYRSGLEGFQIDMGVSVPRPKLQLLLALKELGYLIQALKERDRTLPIPGYGKSITRPDEEVDSLIPVLSAGPMQLTLPGVLGHRINATGDKAPITIGFSDTYRLVGDELIKLIINTLKFSIQEQNNEAQPLIPIDDTQSALPFSYLLGYTPATDRKGTFDAYLFHFMSMEVSWFFLTPTEFAEEPSFQDKLPTQVALNQNQDGAVIGLYGKFCINQWVEANVATTVSFIAPNSWAIKSHFSARLSNIFHLGLDGTVDIIEKENPTSQLRGKASIKLGQLEVLNGGFELVAGDNAYFEVKGQLDFFGSTGAVQLYTGHASGKRELITGRVGNDGIVLGHIKAQNQLVASGVHLKVKDFHLSGESKIVCTSVHEENQWYLKFNLHGSWLNFKATYDNDELCFDIQGARDILITSAITLFAGNLTGSLKLSISNSDVQLQHFFLNANLSFLGLQSSTNLQIQPDGFAANIEGSEGVINYNLQWNGKDLNDVRTFKINGTISLSSHSATLHLTLKSVYQNNVLQFTGNTALHFWGKSRMTLSTTFGQNPEAFHMAVSGSLVLFHEGGLAHLYSGNSSQIVALHGHIDSSQLLLKGAFQFHHGLVELGGELEFLINSTEGISLKGTLAFNKGPFQLSGGQTHFSIRHEPGKILLEGNTSSSLDIVSDILKFDANGHLDIVLDEHTKQVNRHRLHGRSFLLGNVAEGSLEFRKEALQYSGAFHWDLGIINLSATCQGTISASNFLLKGIAKVVLKIRDLKIPIELTRHGFTITEDGFVLQYRDTLHGLAIGILPWQNRCTFDDFHRHNTDWANNKRMTLLIGHNDRSWNTRNIFAYRLDGGGEMTFWGWKSWGDDVHINWPRNLRPDEWP